MNRLELFVAFFLVTAFVGPNVLAATDKQDNMQLLAQANDYFQQANVKLLHDPAAAKELYGKALLRYEHLVDEGVRNGKLFYNIGNTYYRLDDIGRAVLNYRRAQLFIPDDPDLRQSLGYVLSKRQDRIEEKQEEQVLKILFFWHYDLSAGARLWIFGICYSACFLFATLKAVRYRKLSWWLIGVPAFVALLFFGSVMADRLTAAENRMGVLVESEVVARKGDGDNYRPSFKGSLHAGTEFRLLEDRGAWRHIELADGRRCWIKARSGEMVIDGGL